MSVIAFTATRQGIVMLSDGRRASAATGKANSMKFSKARKTADQVGFFWLGWYPYTRCVEDMQTALEGRGAKDAAQAAGEELRGLFNSTRPDALKGPDRFRYCLIIVGYAGGKPVVYQIDSENDDMFIPERVPCQYGDSGLMGYDAEASAQHGRYTKLLREYAHTTPTLGKACKRAFTDIVRDLEAKGLPIGGDIFCEVLQPRVQSKFQKAISQL